MRYRLRTLLILLAVGPVMIWGGFAAWSRYVAWRELKQAKTPPQILVIPYRLQRQSTRFPPESDYQIPPPSHFEMRQPK
jgi:hypothetical protein